MTELSEMTIMTAPSFQRDPLDSALQDLETLLQSELENQAWPGIFPRGNLLTEVGTQLRPRLSLLSGWLFKADPRRTRNLAAAIELLQAATKIHEMLEEGTDYWGGQDTDTAPLSGAAGVLAGDFVFTRAAALAETTGCMPVIKWFAETMATITDTKAALLLRPQGFSKRAEYYDWIQGTAAALFGLAAGAPALLGGADEVDASTACRFGYHLGLAVKIQEDTLDENGLRRGFLALPALLYLEDHPTDPLLRAVIRKEVVDAAALQECQKHIRRSGAVDRALMISSSHVRKALDHLAQLPDTLDRYMLAELALKVVEQDFYINL